jgi:endonuclease-8
MPEGDNLFRAATSLRKALQGSRVTAFRSDVPAVLRALEQKPIDGARIAAIDSRGKHLLFRFDDGRTLRTHLRMRGSWHLYRLGERWRRPERSARAVIETDAGFVAACFDAPLVELVTEFGLRDLARLGPDATADAFDDAEALRRLRARGELPIGEALLVQRALAGVGNVIKAEVLFSCRQDPFQPVSEVADEQLARIVAEAHRLLVHNRSSGPRTTRPALTGPRLWVYGRSGKPCLECGTTVRMRRQGVLGRSTYYCPRCQGSGAI